MKTLGDEQLMLLYPLTFAFSLKAKEWIELDASRLEEVKKSDRSYESLVLSDDSKKMIQAVVRRLERQETESTWSADFVAGKGSGGIILLHGPPGVGKTFTVEAIAEKLDSPLLALTVADIGTQETMIERKLLQWFTWAEMWKAVLLIDEADIFLERRHTRDLTRNGLVSAFLRRAEYFDGLLFLTTNRVGHIDDAFISRVQVPVLYQHLTGEQLAKIWEHFFAKLALEMRQLQTKKNTLERTASTASANPGTNGETSKPPLKTREIVVLPRAKTWVMNEFKKGTYPGLNGRDIRNALQAAITLADYDAHADQTGAGEDDDTVMVDITHFSDVLDMSCNFRNYISGIRHADEPQRAHHRGDRPYDGTGYGTRQQSPDDSPSLGRLKMGSASSNKFTGGNR
jgi:SpoVK/Ycf46/Vps4 family AAA+-type ATPase